MVVFFNGEVERKGLTTRFWGFKNILQKNKKKAKQLFDLVRT